MKQLHLTDAQIYDLMLNRPGMLDRKKLLRHAQTCSTCYPKLFAQVADTMDMAYETGHEQIGMAYSVFLTGSSHHAAGLVDDSFTQGVRTIGFDPPGTEYPEIE